MIRTLFIFLLLPSSSMLFAQTAEEILKKSEQKLRGNSSYSELEITIVRPKYTRTMGIKSWSKGDQFALMLVTAPARDKGTVFLKRNREVWNWVPSVDRSIKMPPSMMAQSWMGTDLTNDDLVRESSLMRDFSKKLIGKEKAQGRECYKIELTPKPDAAVVWGKIVVWIDTKDFMQMKSEFYDEDQFLVNTFLAYDIKTLGGQNLPSRLEIIPADKEGHKTIMTYKELKLNVPIEDQFFTLQNMKKVQ
jgi:outer membrane lipoprotein-sorting protein